MEFKYDDNRIYITNEEDEIIAEVTFPNIKKGLVNINHTYVSTSMRGQGVAGELMEACYDSIKKQEKKAVVTCPYAVKWLDEHPEKGDVLKKR